MTSCFSLLCFFFFNGTATTEIYSYLHTLSLHDALPIFRRTRPGVAAAGAGWRRSDRVDGRRHTICGAVGQGPSGLRLLPADVRAGHQSTDRSAARADRDVARMPADRKSVVLGKRVSVRVDLGGRRIIKKKKTIKNK